MDYEIFISENIQEVTKQLNDVIQSFKVKGLKISFDYIDRSKLQTNKYFRGFNARIRLKN